MFVNGLVAISVIRRFVALGLGFLHVFGIADKLSVFERTITLPQSEPRPPRRRERSWSLSEGHTPVNITTLLVSLGTFTPPHTNWSRCWPASCSSQPLPGSSTVPSARRCRSEDRTGKGASEQDRDPLGGRALRDEGIPRSPSTTSLISYLMTARTISGLQALLFIRSHQSAQSVDYASWKSF